MYAMYSQQMLKGQYGALELQSTISLVSFMTESDTHINDSHTVSENSQCDFVR